VQHPSRRHTPFRHAALLALLAGFALGQLPVLAQDQPPSEDDLAKKQAMEAEQAAQAQIKKEIEAKEAAAAAAGRTRATAVTQPGQAPDRAATGSATGSATGAAPRGGATRGPGLNIQTSSPAGAQPGRASGAIRPDEVSLAAYSEGIDLKVLVEYVAETLQINIVASDNLQGSVVLNAPVVVKKTELLTLLDALLEQYNFTITLDPQTGFYKVLQLDSITVTFDGDRPTTRIIATPTVRPSALAEPLNQHIGTVAAAAGQGGAARSRISFLDDLGVIVVTDSPRRIELMQQFINVLSARFAEQQHIRFDLEHISASTARARVLELVGRSSPTALLPGAGAPGQPLAVPGLTGANFDNLADRLIADAQSNALILRGYPEEETKIRSLLTILDRPGSLEYKQYFAGSAALQIAQLAERFGFGTVETVETATSREQPGTIQGTNIRAQQNPLNLLQQNAQAGLGGPVMVVDPSRGAITYNGTASQQAALQKLIASFNPQLEIVEFRAYKIKNMPATDMADLLTALIFNEEVSRSDTSNSFLPGSGRRGSSSRTNRSTGSGSNSLNQFGIEQTGSARPQSNQRSNTSRGGSFSVGGRTGGPLSISAPGQPEGDGVAAIGGQDVFLTADSANNQVVAKATARDHVQIAKLIDKLDQRRPQVNIEVQIVSVSATDDFRLAFEAQGVFDRGRDGAFNTNFGLGNFVGTTTGSTTTPGNFVGPKSVVTNLAGLTAAIVRSDHVPIIMTALKRNADTRILSSPQLLVDDNEFAEIVSLDLQPTTTTQIGNTTSQTAFGGYEEAGTTLAVTPSISEGGYMRLEYQITLSNFIGTGSAGVPPPKQERSVSSSSVTIPGNATIIVGGIKLNSEGKTIVKVPLLGDIPIVGHLFSDTNKANTSTRLYVFITPRIMRDVNFGDVSLLTRGHAEDAGVKTDGPPLLPIMMKMNDRPTPPVPSAAAKREDESEGTQP
jgi:type II secretory pathway component GspD/PulD (secretin)